MSKIIPNGLGDKLIAANLLPALSSLPETKQKEVVRWAKSAVEQYAVVLNNKRTKLKPIKWLPSTKEELKLAIKFLLLVYITKNAAPDIELLKKYYVSLSSFQQFDRNDQKELEDTMDDAFADNGIGDFSEHSSYQKYLDIAMLEQNILLEDINSFIADNK
jgi:hypothetical protein